MSIGTLSQEASPITTDPVSSSAWDQGEALPPSNSPQHPILALLLSILTTMVLVLLLAAMLVVRPLEKTLALPVSPGEPASDHTSLGVSSSRCKVETLQGIRKTILHSLRLQVEPHVTIPGMAWLRHQWKTTFEGTSQIINPEREISVSVSSSETLSPGNATAPVCCTLTSQIFIKDLGWDKWIIYPESFTYTRCSACNPQVAQSIFHCAENSPTAQDSSSQTPCCEPTSHDLVPFLYVDATSTLVITSVPITRECGCRPVDDHQALNP